jgi:hypothetical protein
VLVVELTFLSLAGKVPRIVKGVHVPVIELRRSERQATSRLIGKLGIKLPQIILQIISLKHLGGLNVNVMMRLFSALVIFGLVRDQSPERDPTSSAEFFELQGEVGGCIKRDR